MKNVKIKLLKPYAGINVGEEMSLETFDGLQHPLALKNLDRLIEVLSADRFIEVVYPMYFALKDKGVMYVYARNPFTKSVEYVYNKPCGKTLVVPFFEFLESEWQPIFSCEELEEFRKGGGNVTISLDGVPLKEGQMIYYFKHEDGACGQVPYFKGMEKKYANEQYYLFLSQKERDNAAYRITGGKFIDCEQFDKATFTGEQIQNALRKSKVYENSDEYWDTANSFLEELIAK